MKTSLIPIVLFITFGLIGASVAGETELSGYITGDLRVFPSSPVHAGQSGTALNPSLVVQPEFRYEWSEGENRVTAIPFVRLDAQDKERTHFDLRELNWLHVGESWDLRVGVEKVFWGVTESRHLVDIINQTDLVEDLDGEDKLGQPMVNFGVQRDWGNLNFFILPFFRERTFPGKKGRLRGPIPVDTDNPVFGSSAEEWHVDFAIRYETVIGDWDIGVAHFYGTGREPRFVLGMDVTGNPVLIPQYDIINQSSVDVQATLGDWLLKLESIVRSGQGDTFGAVVTGFEYTFYGVFNNDTDVSLLVEYIYDDRDEHAAPTSQDNDIFLALRLALNDTNDTNFLGGVFVDLSSGATFINLETNRRLSDQWKLEIEARAFASSPMEDPAFVVRKDHHLQIRLARYF